ncbi:hypothetical protein I6F30_06545 [Bradyrhizobium sp. NBAIM20]|uniref:Transposase DDE domain-containing protein n=1 Tax=Bradyrhizobium yuanmingense TaxID=108015 RepID=A0ABV4GG17_9BRAD|nr:hypothetical protein [Bradyrhizobium sp. NBAIM20]MCA1461655.1 hypothetical protein [Bradyrhizobium sp. NBAIM18]
MDEGIGSNMPSNAQNAAYGLGIRRRLARMFGNERRRIEPAFSLLFSLPGTSSFTAATNWEWATI